MIDLHPPAASYSNANGIHAGQQVGRAWITRDHAALWHGTAASFVDLHPAGYLSSEAHDVYDGVQFGRAETTSNRFRAALWRGTPESFVSLHPPDEDDSLILAAHGEYQTGWVYFPFRACVWQGTAASAEPLPTPAGYSQCFGEGIWADGSTIRVAGYCLHTTLNRHHAMLWTRSIEPSCYGNCDASTAVPALNVADFTCFLQRFAAGDSYANCDGSTTAPTLNVADFTCFLQQFAAGCP